MQLQNAPDPAVAALQRLTPDLVGLALRSVEEVADVSLAQMRLLLVLHARGRTASTEVARALDVNASSVTRMVDRLVASGHVVRRPGAHRTAVELDLTDHGHETTDAVLAWRSRELSRVVGTLDERARASLVESLDQLHSALAVTGAQVHDTTGPVPL